MDCPILNMLMSIILLAAATTDLRSCRVPNWLTVSAMVMGLSGHVVNNGLAGMIFSLEGLGLGLMLFLAVSYTHLTLPTILRV